MDMHADTNLPKPSTLGKGLTTFDCLIPASPFPFESTILRRFMLVGLIFVVGINLSSAQPKPATAEVLARPSAATENANSEPSASSAAEEQVLTQQAQLVERLLKRIEELEVRQEAQSRAEHLAQQAVVDKLLARIGDLESKVSSLESGRVLPEIAVVANDAPSNRELDQKIKVVERKNELAAEAAAAKAKEAPRVSIGQNGFAISSADTNFVLKLRGLVQFDSRAFFSDNARAEGNDTFLVRRARPIIEGTVFRDFDFQLVPDFAGSQAQLFDANINYRFRPELQLKAGKFKGPVGFENLQSDATLPFNERGLPANLTPSRSVGLQLGGYLADGALSYAAGIFNGSGDARLSNNSDFGDDKEFAARVYALPFKNSDLAGLEGLGFGVGASYSQVSSNALGLPGTTGGTLPGYVTSGLQQFFAYNPTVGTVVADGTHWRVSPHLTYLYGPFGLLGEYALSKQGVLNGTTQRRANLEHTAWQVSAQWVLTGESASFAGITPSRPFDLKSGGWGAWQLVARYGAFDVDDAAFQGFANPATSASAANTWSLGLNWWLNKNVRILTSYSHTTFDGGGTFNPLDPSTQIPPGSVTQQDEDLFFTRFQISF
jgi:phosphate-selective porin OprO/OprP